MSDVECPYCGHEQEINHDCGYGCNEGFDYEQDCINCGKAFKFTTSITLSYEVMCQDEDHVMEPFGEKWPGMYQCKNCSFYERVEPKTPIGPEDVT